MNIKFETLKHVETIDYYLKFKDFSGKSLQEWITPLLVAMTDKGAIPYLLDPNRRERFRASPLASTIIGLDSAHLLPDCTIDAMQDKLLYLRDNAEEADPLQKSVEKKEEDIDGWSYSEGVSVWSTSMALLALMCHKDLACKRAERFKKSVLWLARQKQVGKNGWGYQLSNNCIENVPMTALAVRALALCYQSKDVFALTIEEEETIMSAMTAGFQYIKDSKKTGNNLIWWEFNNQKSCVATVWALCAIKELCRIGIVLDSEDFYLANRFRGVNFVVSCMPSAISSWKSEQFVCEGGAKYNKQKNYYSFSSALLSDLFELGLSPYHPKVIKQIRWLIENSDKWQIQGYDRTAICSFTYAMVLGVLAKWRCMVGEFCAKRILEKESHLDKIAGIIYGLPVYHSSEFQMILKRRTLFLWIISILIICFTGKIIKGIIKLTTAILIIFGQQWSSIAVNVLSCFIYAGIITLATFVYHKLFRRNTNDQ